MPHRRIHIVAGKRQAVLKALGDMYNLETPKKPLNPGPELALTRVGHGGQFLEEEAEPWGEAPEGWPVVSSGVPLGRVSKAAPQGAAPCLLGRTLRLVLWRSGRGLPPCWQQDRHLWDHSTGPLLTWTQMDQRGGWL